MPLVVHHCLGMFILRSDKLILEPVHAVVSVMPLFQQILVSLIETQSQVLKT